MRVRVHESECPSHSLPEKQDGAVLKWEVDTIKYPRRRKTESFPKDTIPTASIVALLAKVDHAIGTVGVSLFLNVCGPSGAGKSEALRVLVAKHRHDGRLVLYEVCGVFG